MLIVHRRPRTLSLHREISKLHHRRDLVFSLVCLSTRERTGQDYLNQGLLIPLYCILKIGEIITELNAGARSVVHLTNVSSAADYVMCEPFAYKAIQPA